MSRTSSALLAGVLASAAGALDGLAASGDEKAGRHWDTTGISLQGGPVLSWGLAPAVQLGTSVVGVAAMMTGATWGRGLIAAGEGTLARALAYKLAQRGQPTPTPTQG